MIKIGFVEDNAQLAKDKRDKVGLGEDLTVSWEGWEGSMALKAKEEGSLPDVVLMDIAMLGMDGIEATKLTKAKFPDLKILRLTVMDDEKKLFEALKTGESGYRLKEVKTHHLLNAFDDVLEEGLTLSTSLASMVLNYLKAEPKTPEVPSLGNERLSKREKDVLQWLNRECPSAKLENICLYRKKSEETFGTYF